DWCGARGDLRKAEAVAKGSRLNDGLVRERFAGAAIFVGPRSVLRPIDREQRILSRGQGQETVLGDRSDAAVERYRHHLGRTVVLEDPALFLRAEDDARA